MSRYRGYDARVKHKYSDDEEEEEGSDYKPLLIQRNNNNTIHPPASGFAGNDSQLFGTNIPQKHIPRMSSGNKTRSSKTRSRGYPAEEEHRSLLHDDYFDIEREGGGGGGGDQGDVKHTNQPSYYGAAPLPTLTATSAPSTVLHQSHAFPSPSVRSTQRPARRRMPKLKKLGQRVNRNNNPAPDLSLGGCFSYGCCCVQCVRTKEVGIVEHFGQFERLAQPGLQCFMWPCTDIAGRLSLRLQQLEVVCVTKTKDNVFVNITTAVQYKIMPTECYDAFYRLSNPKTQITSHVLNVIRSTIPSIHVDDVFASKKSIALSVLEDLSVTMKEYGYEILDALVTDISPDEVVKASMNEINASRRLKEAISHKAEAEKVNKIKTAEAIAEASHLSGIGLANQRKAIAQGMKKSIALFTSSDGEQNKGLTPKDVMDILLLSQYFDTLSAIGANSTILRHDAGFVGEVRGQIASIGLSVCRNYGEGSSGYENIVIPDLLS